MGISVVEVLDDYSQKFYGVVPLAASDRCALSDLHLVTGKYASMTCLIIPKSV